ncbi:MAG: peptidylprolyl isomerase [Bacteroidales bacterium]|nr:peptidylprolyl isomerase [Bacteroidales bacterium]
MATGLLLAFVLGLIGCVKDSKTDYIARVDDLVLTEEDLFRTTPPEYISRITEDQKKRYIEEWIEEALFFLEAQKQHLDKDPVIMERLNQVRWQILVEAYVEHEIRSRIEITEDDLLAYFDYHNEEFVRLDEEWRASHILVSTEEKGLEILEELKQDKGFDDLAIEHSEDPSAENGGDLGYFSREEILPELSAVLMKMEIGQISGLIKSDFGYHLLQLTDYQPAGTIKDFEDVREEIKNLLFFDKYNKLSHQLVDSLRTVHLIETQYGINDSL